MHINESNFIYGEIEEQSASQNGHSNINRSPLQSNHIVKGMNNEEQKPQKMQVNFVQSQILMVKPVKSVDTQPQPYEQVQMQQPLKQYQPISTNKQKINKQQNLVFSYEESEQLEEDPQSSIRKLYKAMKREESTINKHQQEKTMQVNSESHLYEDQSEQEQEEQMENKTQIRSRSLRQIILFKVPKTKLVKCFVKIANDSFFTLQNVFHFYLVEQKQLLMTARKKRFRITSKYQIFGKNKQHVEKLAVARSNYSRTEYKLTLLNQVEEKQSSALSSLIKITKISQENQQPKYTQEQKCYLCYEPNILGFSQQKVDIIKPKKKIDQTERFSDIKNTFENCQFQRIEKFANRLAQRDIQGNLVLDFKDSNITYSPKNMIVQNQYGQACMLLGKRRDDLFIVDVMNPFNFLESFFVAICNLDRKLFAH